MSCGERLNRAGTAVTIYDRSSRIGGLLQTGVPSFKLDKALLTRRKTLLEQAGIRFALGISVDEAILSRLLEENDAVFLGLGGSICARHAKTGCRPVLLQSHSRNPVPQAQDCCTVTVPSATTCRGRIATRRPSSAR